MSRLSLEKKEIKRWWDFKRQLRWKDIYKKKDYSSLALNNRKDLILKYFNTLNLKNIKVLEIGFGGGQLAYEIIKKNNSYFGIDISKKLSKVAQKRCAHLSSKRYSFKVATIEKPLNFKKSYFDLVVVAGVLQYSLKPRKVFNEIHKVLKKDSFFICAQTNLYKLNYFLNMRSLLVRIFYMISNENLAISDSYRSLLLETKLKKYFSNRQKKKIIESKFFNKNFVSVNFKFKKRVMHRKKIVNLAKKTGFKIVDKNACGPYLKIGYKRNIYWYINLVIELLANVRVLSFLKNFGESQVIVLKK